ncbi:MAG TPA: hypothetical protein VGC42_31750 [Kofleriaceae bacterium]
MMDAGDEADRVGAAEQTELQISPQPSPTMPPTATMAEATKSVAYTSGSVTASTIWPTNRGISSVEIVYTEASRYNGKARFLAFVVWNGNFVSHIFCSPTGSSGTELQNVIANTLEARVTYGTDLSAIITGSGTGGQPVPVPRPNVDGQFTFDATFLNSIKSQAVAALNASPVFHLPTAPIYEPGE